MGIKGLHKFLRKNIPHIYEEISLKEYSYCKIAVDISLYLYKFKAINPNNWLLSFIILISTLRKNNIHCIFIFDTSSPPEKQIERKRRAEEREKMAKRVLILEEALHLYKETNEISSTIQEFLDKKPKPFNNINNFEYYVSKMKEKIISITKEDLETVKELFDILDVPYFNSPEEAENTCAKLCLDGEVDAVLSEDSDLLAYGCPMVLNKINISTEKCSRINFEKLLEELEYTKEQFLDFCIMCGTDYNKNIYRIGPEKSYKLIEKYESIENIKENMGYDISILNHNRVREIFLNPKSDDIKMIYCGFPDIKRLEEFIFINNCKIDINMIKDSFFSSNIIIDE